MSVWILIGACLLVPPLWASAVAQLIRRRERRRSRALLEAASRADYHI